MGLQKEYISWIDTAKGIGVFLVVYGHMLDWGFFSTAERAIYSFHMPLFFILSGFVMFGAKRESLVKFFQKNILRLLIPTVIYVLMFLPSYLLESYEGIHKLIIRMTYYDGRFSVNVPCWFFIVLFEVKVIERILKTADRTRITRVISMLLTFALGYLLYRSKNIFLPFGINRCVTAFGFCQVGIFLRDFYENSERKFSLPLKSAAVIAVAAVWVLSGCILNTKISFYKFELGNYWLFIVSGITGSVLIMLFSSFIDGKTEIFVKCAKASILIIGTHYFIVKKFEELMQVLLPHKTPVYDVVSFLFAILLIMIYVPLSKFVEKKIPILFGKTKTAVIH